MLKMLLAMACLYSLSHADIQVTELFRAETPEELEAALVDGYPMPWLAEVLADSTIPEEDRYWLDCRMRAAIAQELHLFFDREGNRIEVEAEWIAPGEDYWRENVMVNLLEEGEAEEEQRAPMSDLEGMLFEAESHLHAPVYSPDRPAMMSSDPGLIYNLYGEQVGELAVVNNEVVLSRDATIGAVQSGGNEALEHRQRQPYACFLYPDGSFLEIPFDSLGRYRAAVSDDGSRIAFVCTEHSWSDPHAAMIAYNNRPPDDVIIDAYVFDRDGCLLGRITPETPFTHSCWPKMDQSGRVLAANVWGGVGILDCDNGAFRSTIAPIGNGNNLNDSHLSPDGSFLCAAGYSRALIVDMKTLRTIWRQPNAAPETQSVATCSNGARVIALTTLRKRADSWDDFVYTHSVFVDRKTLIYAALGRGVGHREMVVSPEGSFLVTQGSGGGRSSSVLIIDGDE